MGSMFEIMNSGNTFRIDHAKWEGDNTMRIARNKKEASDVAMKDFTVSLGNQRRVEAAGKDYNNQVANLGKVLNQTTSTDVNLTMAAEQTHGALYAKAAAEGVGGSSVDLINMATDLQRNMQQDMNKSERNSAAVFGSKQAADTIDKAWEGMDNSVALGNFDHSTVLEPRKLKNRWGAMIAVGVMTYFTGPQGGQATADVILASNKAANGKYDQAGQYFNSAAQNAAGAFNDWKNVQDGSGDKKPWGQAIMERSKKSDDALKRANDQSDKLADTGSTGSWWS